MYLFNFTIKSHYLAHIALSSRYINPRLAWCYAGEDFMQKVKTIVASTQRGTQCHLVSKKAMQKYCQGLAFTCLEGAFWK